MYESLTCPRDVYNVYNVYTYAARNTHYDDFGNDYDLFHEISRLFHTFFQIDKIEVYGVKIPKKIKIAAHVYDVVLPYKFTERSDLRGQSDHLTCKIKIADKTLTNEDVTPVNLQITTLHEIIHCVDMVYNAGQLDEPTVERLGEGLYQVLQENGFFKD